MKNQTRQPKISTADAVVNFFKKRIEDGVLKPGDKLPSERQLQSDLMISRFTLREALARLSALGIIETAHGKGTYVSTEVNSSRLVDIFLPLFANQSMKDVIDFFEARVLIESEAAVLGARRRAEEDLDAFERILRESRQAINNQSRYGELDFQFHMQIAKSSGNIFIQKMTGCLNEFTKKYIQAISSASINRTISIEAHAEIYDCIKRRDAEMAGAMTKRHLSRMLKILEKMKAEHEIGETENDLPDIRELLKRKKLLSS